MKKHFRGFIAGVIVTILLLNSTGFASNIKQKIDVMINSINIEVNGKKVEADNILYNNTTYVPLRKVAEMLGKEVDWDGATNTAGINDIPINRKEIVTESKEKTSDFNTDKYKVDNKDVFKGYFHNTDYSDPNAFLNSNGQTKITKEIQNIADNFNDNKDLSTVREIYQWIVKNMRGTEGEKFGRTSHDILTSKGLTGCTDYGLAFVPLARAKGIPTVFVQTARIDWIEARQKSNSGMITGHILAEVFIDIDNDGKKEWCLVDSTSGRLYLGYDTNNFSLSEGYYVFAKSLEVWDSGAKNEQENHKVMMDLFKDFDLSLYKNPKYQYINLLTGKEEQTNEFRADSTVIGNSAQILGEKEPAELFDRKYTSGFKQKNLVSFSSSNKKNMTSTQRIIALYSNDMSDSIPDFVKELIPELNNSYEEYIMNKVRDGRRVIVIIAKDINRLLEIIEDLPDDFLDNDYEE
ncbi:MAG: stalk domain-containing protein [Tissierellales bacterium]